jgi:hypothetical protein
MTYDPKLRLSIVAYKPKPGMESELMTLAHEHVPYLRSIGLVTERPHVIALAEGGTVVEVFEWVEGGIARAHEHSGLQEMWKRYAEVCDYVPLNTLPESSQMFANFVPVNE